MSSVTKEKFLNLLHIYRVFDLPYQSQITALAAILADIGNAWDSQAVRDKLARWYWCGVFGELYGSTVDTRIGRDFVQVPDWLQGGKEPSTVNETEFRDDRLKTMRMRLSAAYKGVNALLMRTGARDLRSGQNFQATVFFDENVDIHHIFPQAWCREQGIEPAEYDSIINKTPLSARTNRIIGGHAPSHYLAGLENGANGGDQMAADTLGAHLESHLIDAALLRADDFHSFMKDRQRRLVELIESAMGKSVLRDGDSEDFADEDDEDAEEARMIVAAEQD